MSKMTILTDCENVACLPPHPFRGGVSLIKYVAGRSKDSSVCSHPGGYISQGVHEAVLGASWNGHESCHLHPKRGLLCGGVSLMLIRSDLYYSTDYSSSINHFRSSLG